jgi:hypothetical protein
VSRQQRIRLDRVANVNRINHDPQQFRLVGDPVQVDDFDAAERLAVVVDERAALPAVGDLWSGRVMGISESSKRVRVERGWPAAGPPRIGASTEGGRPSGHPVNRRSAPGSPQLRRRERLG